MEERHRPVDLLLRFPITGSGEVYGSQPFAGSMVMLLGDGLDAKK